MDKAYYQEPNVTQYCGNALEILPQLEADSVQCVITSPPYWGLRKYSGEQEMVWGDNHCVHEWGQKVIVKTHHAGETNPGKEYYTKDSGQWSDNRGSTCLKCNAWRGAFGLEPTPEMYVEHTIEFLRAIRRVLRKDGCVFLNLGDSYASGIITPHKDMRDPKDMMGNSGWTKREQGTANTLAPGLKPKDLCLIPFRVALAAQADGWWVRSVIIWSKPNPMPESVKDRPTESHEYILMLTKSAKYYWDIDAVRDPLAYPERTYNPDTSGHKTKVLSDNDNRTTGGLHDGRTQYSNPAGRNIRTVWTMNTQPFPKQKIDGQELDHFATFPEELPRKCILAASKQGDIVLDCFSGAGTTGLVAKQLGRKAILIDTSEDYCRMAQRRIEGVPIPMELSC